MSETTTTCSHNSQFVIEDHREGVQVCTNCALVLNTEMTSLSLSDTERTSPFVSSTQTAQELAIIRKARQLGIALDFVKMRLILQDFVENHHLPTELIDACLSHAGQSINRSDPEPRRSSRSQRIGLEEFTALMTYQTLLVMQVPRPIHLVASFAGVLVRRLNAIERIFPLASSSTFIMKPSQWMPGVEHLLPLRHKEATYVGELADQLQQDFSHHPATILTVVIFAYMKNQANWGRLPTDVWHCLCFMSGQDGRNCWKCRSRSKIGTREVSLPKQCLTKTELCTLMGISTTTLVRGLKQMIEKNPRFSVNHLDVLL